MPLGAGKNPETVPMLQNGPMAAQFQIASRKFGGVWKLSFFVAAVQKTFGC